MRPRYLPPLPDEPLETGRALLRDGTTVLLRPSEPSDAGAFERFVSQLSPESRRHRFFSENAPAAEHADRLLQVFIPINV
ncbi:MAG: hypothetical protein U0361_19755 [Nitrospiraceae bacterium]